MNSFSSFKQFVQRLRADKSGISLVEFAIMLPVILTLGLYGTEIARMSTTKMKVSQIGLSLADNASRLGQTDNSGITPTITENDVTAILRGAIRQGQSIDMENNGRIILSSLEFDDPSERQFISWQRCIGNLNGRQSRYGDDGVNNGLDGDELKGMGSGKQQITAEAGSAVMFVEIHYTYESLWDAPFGSGDREFYHEAAFLIRDDRNLNPDGGDGLVGDQNDDTRC